MVKNDSIVGVYPPKHEPHKYVCRRHALVWLIGTDGEAIQKPVTCDTQCWDNLVTPNQWQLIDRFDRLGF